MIANDRTVVGACWRVLLAYRAPTTRELLFVASLVIVVIGAVTLQTPYLAVGAAIWAVGISLLVASCWHRRVLASLSDLALTRAESIALASVLGTASFLRLWSLDGFPNGIHIDEAAMGLIAREILQGGGPHPFGFAFIADPAPLMYVKAAFLALFGESIRSLRLLSALSGVLGVGSLWLLARPLFGRGVALLATAMLAVTASHLHFSRLALTIIEIPFLGVLGVALVWRGLSSGQAVWHLLAGIALGLAQYANFGARAYVLAVGGLYVVALVVRRREWPLVARGAVIAGFGMLAVLAPQLAFVRDDPAQLVDRLRYRSVFRRWDQATDIHQTDDPTGVMVGQLLINVRAFVDGPDRGTFYEFADEPLLYGPIAALFLAGSLMAIWHVREPRFATLLLICVAVLLAGILSAGAPQFHRLVPMVPVACLLAAIALLTLTRQLDWLIKRSCPRLLGAISLAVPMLVVGMTAADSVSEIFVRQPSLFAWQPHSAWARWIATQPADRPIYVAGAPDVRAWDERLRFLADARALVDVANPTVVLPTITAQQGAATLALSPRLSDWLPYLRYELPGATFEPVDGPDGRPLLIAVSIPAAPRPSVPFGGLRGEILIDGNDVGSELRRLDPVIAFRESGRLGDQRPYHARWSGTLLVDADGPQRLEAFTDGGVELIVDGKTAFDAPTTSSQRSIRSDLRLTRGEHTIELLYTYIRGPGTLELRWQPPGGTRSLIPPSALRPD